MGFKVFPIEHGNKNTVYMLVKDKKRKITIRVLCYFETEEARILGNCTKYSNYDAREIINGVKSALLDYDFKLSTQPNQIFKQNI
jgi:hypothetical protein